MNVLDTIIFWGASAVAIIATLLVILGKNPFTAVLYLILSLFGVSMIFYTLGAPFLAVLEIIVYAGAIMVLFLFVVQMLSPGVNAATPPDMARPTLTQTVIPGVLALILIGVLMLAVVRTGATTDNETTVITAKALGMALFQHHYLGVELASLILLIGIVGGMHLGRAASDDAEEMEQDVAIR